MNKELDAHKLITNLYSLIDPENWEENEKNIKIESLKTFFGLIDNMPKLPGLAVNNGCIVALWACPSGAWRVTAQCLDDGNVCWAFFGMDYKSFYHGVDYSCDAAEKIKRAIKTAEQKAQL